MAMVPLPLLGKGRKHHLDYSDPKTEEIGGGVVHTQRKLALLTVQSLKFGCSSRFAPPSRTSTPQDNQGSSKGKAESCVSSRKP